MLVVKRDLELVGRRRNAEGNVDCEAALVSLDRARLPIVTVDGQLLVEADVDTVSSQAIHSLAAEGFLPFRIVSRPEPPPFMRVWWLNEWCRHHLHDGDFTIISTIIIYYLYFY
ncbi:hypothetical protein N0B31_11330 [Salinirubellus salinus]|uniref:Uncharacterized protein n=1 Tax=Salinirubellus salinus TaxID=1364945 RepID=A0A9E7U8Z0_9EURY|nr:hypothetical protein [Salinirubellus salinus]UWM52743.1 hypothetical protein N0B31_11330 [Salinirubellus salinus]